MKKLLFVFVIMFTLALSGCGTQNESTNGFGSDDNTSENSENSEDKTPEESADQNATETEETNAKNNSDAQPVMVENAEKAATNTTNNTELKITSFKGENLETEQAYNVVRGTTPKNTYSVVVNGYKLQKYYPGQTAWSYIASEKYKTLKLGKNDYTVKALDKSGKELASVNFSINYKELDEHKLPNVGNSAWLSLLLTLSIMAGYLITRQKKLL